MDNFAHLDLQDCPLCGGVGSIEEENGWLVFVQCLDCGSRTAEMAYNSEEERQEMARRVVHSWNIGKVIYTGNGD